MKAGIIKVLKKSKVYLLICAFLISTGFIFSILQEKEALTVLVAGHRTAVLNEVFRLITRLGEGHIFVFFILYYLFFSVRKVLALIITGFLCIVISFLTKAYFAHPRPMSYLEDLGRAADLGHIEGYHMHQAMNSFPSGHTLTAFALFTMLSFFTTSNAIKIFLAILALSAGISRIYLGQHFLQDVVFGAFSGIIIAIGAYVLIFHGIMKSKEDKPLIRF